MANVCVMSGRATADPVLEHTDNQTPVCKLRIAVDGSREGRTTFIDVQSYGNGGKAAAEHVRRGDLIEVSGTLDYDEWEAKDGSGKRSRHFVVGRIGFLRLRSGSNGTEPEPEMVGAGGHVTDDIPF